MITLKDVAKEAGVSVSTVSRVISDAGTAKASEVTKERVWKAIRKLGYVPNDAARELRLRKEHTRRSPEKTLACVTTRPFASSDSFFIEIIQAASNMALQRGYLLKHLISAYHSDYHTVVQSLLNDQILGLILLGKADDELLRYLGEHFEHFVYCSLNFKDNTSINQVVCNGYMAAKAVVQYLIDRGHQKIGYVGEVEHEMRYLGFISALEENGIQHECQHVIESSLTMDSAYKATKKRFNLIPRPTALFCANDNTAIGVMKALKELDLDVPKDLSIISVDDIEMARYTVPMLTTVHIPKIDLGRVSAMVLIDRVEGNFDIPFKIELPFHIVERQTVAKINPYFSVEATKETAISTIAER